MSIITIGKHFNNILTFFRQFKWVRSICPNVEMKKIKIVVQVHNSVKKFHSNFMQDPINSSQYTKQGDSKFHSNFDLI